MAEKPFAEHVRGSLYSPLDLFRRFKRLVDWLINDPDVPPALFAKMFMLWSSDDLLPIERRRLSKKHRSYISSLPEQLAESGNKRLLNATASAVGSEFNAGHSLAIDCLRRSAKLGSTFGKRMFSNVLSAEVSEEVKEEARTFLKEVANEDDPGAMLMLGNRLIAGVGFDRDVEQGEYWLDRSAQLGHVRSMESLGGRMVNQDGITGKVNEGLRWLEKAAENKSSSAAAMLGQLYVEGDNVQPNPEKGKELLEMAIAEGHLPAIRLLSVKCFEGREIPLDTERGLALLEQGIEKEDANCIRTLAKRHFLGDGVPADHQRALELLEQGAKKGFNNCRRYLAQELIEAQHIPKADTGSAIALLQDAIADGDAIAMEVLADFYLDREPTKAAEGRSLLMEAIEKGSSYARKNLAERLLEGNGIQSDVEKGVAILEEGIERRDTRSIRALASYLFDEATKSEGDSTRFAKAIQLFRDAIQYDDPFAQVEFALRLLGEPSLSQHHAEARTLIERRAHEEDSTAQRELARILIDSDIDKDKTTATKWLLRAAEGGDLPAMVDLAKCYQKGNGVSKDLGAAQSWLFKATMYEYAPALAYLAQELVTGEHFDRDEDQAKCLLEKTGRLHPGIVYNTGYSFFKLDMTDWSARCFLIAQGYGHSDAANNLAFLIRRDLVPADLDAPHPLTLLKAGIESGDEFPLVNAALCYAAGLLKMKTNWRKADELISRVSRFENLSERLDDETANHPAVFWSGVLKDEANAAEGHLVVGWLAGHGKLEDPEGLSVRKRLELAVEGGWSVPKWLIEKF